MTLGTPNPRHEQAKFLATLPARLERALPTHLPERRWFGDKSRYIDSVVVEDLVSIDEVGKPAALAFVEVRFSTGEPSQYMVPVVVTNADPGSGESTISVDETGYLIDGLTEPAVRSWFVAAMAGKPSSAAESLNVDRDSAAGETLAGCEREENRLLAAEQSNTSILYGSQALVKVFRRLQPGINPDVELTRFLSTRTRFEDVPRYLASMAHRSASGATSVIACAQSFVSNSGDGWSFVLQMIDDRLKEQDADQLIGQSRSVAYQLGEVTASMHLALASDSWTPELAPEPIKRDDAERWADEYLDLIDRAVAALTGILDRLDPHTRDLASLFLEGAPGLRKRVDGFYRLIGRSKTRVHGDYHLGQTLRTINDSFVVIDFEGEPQRSMAERRRKTSPLKDVAGMLRSFSYARGTATAWLSESTRLLPSDLVAWERETRRSFVSGYVNTARSQGETFLPTSQEDLQDAISSWELDKAAYEVLYEINNRPDWLWIPLSGMLKQAGP